MQSLPTQADHISGRRLVVAWLETGLTAAATFAAGQFALRCDSIAILSLASALTVTAFLLAVVSTLYAATRSATPRILRILRWACVVLASVTL
ncbi:hypothetical protein ACIBEJ_00935 [Nonomuraea sp. NPDC050790]|uniref:hypothetical protein n=1 Tax=Nonomuraea sp. NPDC050790 TaxID=3364371 RepID=UPI00379F384E